MRRFRGESRRHQMGPASPLSLIPLILSSLFVLLTSACVSDSFFRKSQFLLLKVHGSLTPTVSQQRRSG